MTRFLVLLSLTAALAFAQVDVTSVNGVVTDPSGAAVPGASVTATNAATGAKFTASTNDRGEYAIPSIPAGAYKLAVTKAGFKTGAVDNVALSVGVPGTVNVKLEVGQTAETIEVSAGAEIVQAATADVSTNLTGKQLTDLPFATRNAVELLVDAPGTQTPTTPRSSTVNGLPKGALNVTIDGMNTQDNNLKSSDGYFSYIYPSVDALQEVTLESSAAGVDSTSQGGAQIKFVTKSGTNEWHGGGFWQDRNTFFNANFFFNNQAGLPRDIVKLNQFGGHIGGPIKKNKLFFFGNVELYRYPGTNLYNRTYLTPSAASGIYTYRDNTGTVRSVNLLQLAAANPAPAGSRAYTTTPDPLLAKTYALEQQLGANGIVKNNQSGNDYNTLTTSYQPTGTDSRNFYTTRIDYNINQNHTFSLVYNFDGYTSIPDFLNGIVPDFPGGGTVLFSNVNTGQRSNRFDGTVSLRSVLTPHLTNEFRGGLNGGTVLFFDAVAPGLFAPWRGFVPSFASPGTSLSGVTTTSGPQRRNAPVKNVGDTMTFLRGSHVISFGGNFDQINLWQQIVGRGEIPSITFGIASNDPIFNGSTSIFNSSTLPGSTSTQQSQAANLYADVTGRVSQITQQLVLDEKTHQYAMTAPIDRDHMREMGLFIQDQWRALPNLSVNLGLRAEKQFAFVNENGLYSEVSYAGLWGVSGVGHLFSPGTLTGQAPVYTQINGSPYDPPLVWAPSVGVAYQIKPKDGFLKIFTGSHEGAAVLRAGYSIATVREGMGVYQSLFASNQGITVDASTSPTTYPANFGPGGSVNFSDTTLPSRVSSIASTPSYPISACFTCSLNGIDPNLKMGYVQSWNIGYQREIQRNTVVEIRYNGNHGTDLWRQLNLNEVNILENGFLSEFQIAANNLAIARGGNIYNQTTNNYGNQGLPGQKPIPIIQTAIGNTTDTTTATYLMMGQAGSLANSIATNATRMTSLTNAGYPANFFVLNPTVAGGGSYVLANLGASYYDAATVEFRRRLSSGLQFQGSYTFAKALAMGATASSSDFSTPTTLRNLGLDKAPESFDIRNAIKFNWIYQLPFGNGRHFGISNVVARKILEGWQIAGVVRLQSGTPLFLNGLGTFNSAGTAPGSGVVLHNITVSQLQSMVGIYKTSLPGPNGGLIYYLPPPSTTSTAGLNSGNNTNFIYNTQAAFNVNGLTPAQVDPNAPYVSPAPAGQLGGIVYVYAPWQRHFDINLQKEIQIKERVNLLIRGSALDVLNLTNFIPPSGNNTASTFGQLGPSNAYRDISGTVDPGSRIIEFLVRLNF
ncbi:MAG TPA: carboxypeptidase-like regulatory domain-containing protein [Bryobacteraceae bacterium]|nr:carboxypeptidase-like regulatory domain-containing protein [Bryobacteraceae bacterium]